MKNACKNAIVFTVFRACRNEDYHTLHPWNVHFHSFHSIASAVSAVERANGLASPHGEARQESHCEEFDGERQDAPGNLPRVTFWGKELPPENESRIKMVSSKGNNTS